MDIILSDALESLSIFLVDYISNLPINEDCPAGSRLVTCYEGRCLTLIAVMVE